MNIYFEGPKYQNSTVECASKFVAVLLVTKNPSSRGGQGKFFKVQAMDAEDQPR
jgi:hypothetical protein